MINRGSLQGLLFLKTPQVISHMAAPNQASNPGAITPGCPPACLLPAHAIPAARMLSPIVSISEHHIRNSEASVQNPCNINLQNTDILVTSDVVYLFTKVKVKDALQLLG
jgi:hypothetical protein